jgi:glycosyltransferase involved in cell wall biosynthesis
MKKLSVIIPFYNQNILFLKKALNSVINQSLTDIEIICIDDGSNTKECSEYILKLQEKDNRILLINSEHFGSGNARNIGINLSNSENIIFLDSDDYYPNNFVLEKLIKFKEENNVLIAGGKHLILNNNNFETPYFDFGNINDYFCNKIVNYIDFQSPFWYWCYVFDSNLIKNNNIFFPLYIRYQDPIFFTKAMYNAKMFYATDEVVYIHRKNQKLFNLTKNELIAHTNAIVELLEYAKLNNLTKLQKTIYNLFFNFDIKLFDNINDINYFQKEQLINSIKKFEL